MYSGSIHKVLYKYQNKTTMKTQFHKVNQTVLGPMANPYTILNQVPVGNVAIIENQITGEIEEVETQALQAMVQLMKNTFLTKAHRVLLTDEYIECAYEVDEMYDEEDETRDRQWLAKLDNVTFMEEMVAMMPDVTV